MWNKSQNKKDMTVFNYMKEKMPSTVTDLGCNTGKQALFAASMGIKSIGLDYAANTIDMATENAKVMGLSCSFGCVDLLNPLVYREYDPPKLKFKSEMVIASALLHHLYMACGDINKSIDTILDYGTKYAAIEFIPHSDVHIRSRKTWHSFEQVKNRLDYHNFKITEVKDSEPIGRKWILAERGEA